MDGILSNSHCPICKELPEAEVYQCVNGHVMCNNCYFQLTECSHSQCGLPLHTGEPIRCRFLEGLLDDRQFDCPFKSNGCEVNLPRNHLKTHQKNCYFDFEKFGKFLNLCNYLGYKNCNFGVNNGNGKETVEHLVNVHGWPLSKSPKFELELDNFERKSKDFHAWTPLVTDYKEKSVYLLTGAVFNEIMESLVFFSIILPYSGTNSKAPMQVEFQISKKHSNFSFFLDPLSLEQIKGDPLFHISHLPCRQTKNFLNKYLNLSGDLVFKCEVKGKSKQKQSLEASKITSNMQNGLENSNSTAKNVSKKTPSWKKNKRAKPPTPAEPLRAFVAKIFINGFKKTLKTALIVWVALFIYGICYIRKSSYEDLGITRENCLKEVTKIYEENWLQDDGTVAPWLKSGLDKTLLLAMAQFGTVEVLRFLLRTAKLDVNTVNELGETPIFYAMMDNDTKLGLDKFKFLLENGADIKIKTNTGRNVLHYAALYSSAEVVEYLIFLQAENEDDSCGNYFLEVNSLDVLKNTPLHCAMQNQNETESLEIIRTLMLNEADCLALNKNGNTPVNLAEEKDSEWMTQVTEIYLEFDRADCISWDVLDMEE